MITYRVQPSTALLRAFGPEAAPRIDADVARTLAELGGLGLQFVTTFTPRGATGALRGSTFTELRGTPVRRQQIIGNRLFYAPIVELGRRPGTMPPPRELERWVARRLGVPPARVAAVAFLVARKIGRVGSAGYHMFQRAAQRLQPLVEQKVAELAARIGRGLGGGSA